MVSCSSGNWSHLLQVRLENVPLPAQVSKILKKLDHVHIWEFCNAFGLKSLTRFIFLWWKKRLLCLW